MVHTKSKIQNITLCSVVTSLLNGFDKLVMYPLPKERYGITLYIINAERENEDEYQSREFLYYDASNLEILGRSGGKPLLISSEFEKELENARHNARVTS